MDYFTEPTITFTSPEKTEQDYFNSVKKESNSSVHDNFENDPPTTISNKHYPPNIYHHPLSKHLLADQKVHSAPILKQQQHLTPPYILQKNVNSSPTITKHIHIEDGEEERRPSVTTFTNNDSHSVFYDAVSSIISDDENDDETQAQTTTIRRKQSPTTPTNKRNSKLLDWKTRRPSMMSRISTTYTNKTAVITIDHIDLEQSHYLHEGTLLCAVVPTWQIKIGLQQKYKHQVVVKKRPLKWKEYRAVITQSGYLELYKICHCKNDMLHSCFHHHYKKPKHVIDLHPSVDNQLFQKAFLINHGSNSETNMNSLYHLSLMSPIDFSWCLSSASSIFYFQSNSVGVSQHWYGSLYTALPNASKKPLPPVCDLMIPELNICIRMTISELIHGEDENVELKKVRESALVLLHRNGNRPPHWNKRTVGLCWKLQNSDQLDWVLKPTDDDNNAYLIEPRLIEKTHELQLRYYGHEELGATQQQEKPLGMKGYLIDKKSTSTSNTLLYGVTMDHYLFLYENKLQVAVPVQQSSWCCSTINKKRIRNHQTFPSTPQAESSTPRSAVGVIDLLKIKEIKEESCDYSSSKDEVVVAAEPQQLLHIDNNYLFQIIHQPINDWSTRLESIRNYYCEKERRNEIMQSTVMYIKSAKSQYNIFKRRLCILANNGDLCIFKPSSKKSIRYEVLQYSLSLTDHNNNEQDEALYIYSGEELCTYVTGLPIQWSSRIYDNGSVVDAENNNQPKQCCFIIHYKNKEYIFLARSQDQKEVWVQSICSFL